MIPVNQEIINKDFGDCQRAVYASLLELPLDAVPNFLRHGVRWILVYRQFLHTCGWVPDWINGRYYKNLSIYAKGFEAKYQRPQLEHSINGYFAASVKSKTYKHTNHAVVIDINGVVIHDPNPNKLYQNENVMETEALIHWDLVTPRTDSEWLAWRNYDK
jgi:hypothetical protein